VQKLRQWSGSCGEVIYEGSGRAGKGEGPEAGRKRACYFTDAGRERYIRSPETGDLNTRERATGHRRIVVQVQYSRQADRYDKSWMQNGVAWWAV
jgi:hypothetical protein